MSPARRVIGPAAAGLALLLSAGAAGGAERFGAATFEPPEGWTRQAGNEALGFVTQATPGTYALLAIYQPRQGSGDPEADFRADWDELVLHNRSYAGEPARLDRKPAGGWTAVIGAGAVTLPSGQGGRALLADFVAGGRVVSVVAQFNDDRYLEEVRRFVGGVTLDEAAPARPPPAAQAAAAGAVDDMVTGPDGYSRYTVAGDTPAVTAACAPKQRGKARWTGPPVAGIWMGFRSTAGFEVSAVDSSFELQVGQQKPRWLTFLADGTFYEGLPRHGLWALDPALERRLHPDDAPFWGTWKASGGRVTAVTAGGRRLDWALGDRLLAEDTRTTGSTRFFKAHDLDGLLLDGTWSTFRTWSEDQAGPRWTGRPLIRFGRDGRFEDQGAFMDSLAAPAESSPRDRRPGRGRYAIEGFTLRLRYDDGRDVHHTLTPPMDQAAHARSQVLFIGQFPFYLVP